MKFRIKKSIISRDDDNDIIDIDDSKTEDDWEDRDEI